MNKSIPLFAYWKKKRKKGKYQTNVVYLYDN